MNNIESVFNLNYDKDFHTMPKKYFINFEMALSVIRKTDSEADALKGYIFFTKYQNIGKSNFNGDDYLLFKASSYLSKFRSQKFWQDYFFEYIKPQYDDVRLFDIVGENNRIIKRDCSKLTIKDNEEAYIKYILDYNYSIKAKSADKGTFSFYNPNAENKYRYINVDDAFCPNEYTKEYPYVHFKDTLPKDKITIKISELIKTAKKIENIESASYLFKVLSENTIKSVKNKRVEAADTIELDKLVNIVGMVGSGKTTLLKILTYYLDSIGKRVVIVTDTVSNVFKLNSFFVSLGCKSSPLIGKSDRLKYINQMTNNEKEYFIDDLSAKYLTTACLADGLDYENENAVPYGEEPCTKLHNKRNNNVCQYYEICPTTLMEREVSTSNIVISTAAGFALSKIGPNKRIFLENVIENFDVVFFDECDRVQKNFDEIFLPTLSFNKFVVETADECTRFIKQDNRDRIKKREITEYYELLTKAHNYMEALSVKLLNFKNNIYSKRVNETFSAISLLNELKDDISEATYREIYSLTSYNNYESSQLYDIMSLGCSTINEDRFNFKINEWIDKNEEGLILTPKNISINLTDEIKQENKKTEKENKRRIEIRKAIIIVISLICFDNFVMEINNSYEGIEHINIESNELFNFMKSRFKQQQEYIPSSLIGNLFGVKILENNDDILLFRQYGYGRSLLTDLPYMLLNKEGTPLGPNVVLLSGTSFAKGSYEYHINADVNYIIEAPTEIRSFLAKTEFIDLGIETRVSGSSIEDKNNLLRDVVRKCTDSIIKDLEERKGKILLIVNSFEQARATDLFLQEFFREKNCNEQIGIMVSDRDEASADRYIRRSEVYQFNSKKARILIAPALAIERGHNIVDESGHSSISAIYFLIRPMAVPNDIKERTVKLNGYMAELIYNNQKFNNNLSIYRNNINLRKEATVFWSKLLTNARMNLDNIDMCLKKDLVSTLFILILQIFGRMCRVTDINKEAPIVYFADGAFRGDEKHKLNIIDEIYYYLEGLMNDEEYGEVAKTLYKPFFEAYKGVKNFGKK